MKRRVKLSLKKDHDKQKRVRVTDCRRQEDRLRQATSDSVPLASGSASASSLKTALDDGDSLEMQLASSSATGDCSKTILGTLASGGDCEVSSSQYYPMMSCGSVDCDDGAPPSSDSGHQMETEGCTEEDEGKVDGSIFCCPGGAPSNSEQELGLEDVDRMSDPISQNDDSDLCTQYELSNTARYSLSSSDVAHFEDFSMPLRPKANPSVKRQTSLLSFMSRTSNSAPSLNSKDGHRLPTPCSSLASCSTGKGKEAVPTHAQSDTEIQTFDSSRGSGRNSRAKRSCPFYKKIPGTSFSVDAFSYGSIPDCSAYFLSHFHYDHYMGLTRKFQQPIYCSKVTANLVKQQIKVAGQFIHDLDMNRPHVIDGVEVTLLDANHCPGSVLFLFKLSYGRYYLHTGDFRFCSAMKNYPQLMNISINQLFLDTTYCSPEYTFPRQEDVIAFAVDKAAAALSKDPGTLIVCGTYTIGKERVFMGLAGTLGLKVYVTREKKTILECLESPDILSVLTSDPSTAGLHVLPMGKLNMNDLSLYLERWNSKFSSIIAFKPTGWTYSSKNVSLASIKPQSRGQVTIFGIPYSEHSSFPELRQFVQFLQPERIIPTVNNHSAKKREEMQTYFKQWLTHPSQPKTIKQTTLDITFRMKT